MQSIPEILNTSKVVAIVGLSDKPDRPSYGVATYLMQHGYKIIPVNPNITEWKGIKTYKSLFEINEPVDVVDIFRKNEDVPQVVDDALKMKPKPKTIWMQLGIVNEQAAEKVRKASLNVVMDKCMKIEHSISKKQL